MHRTTFDTLPATLPATGPATLPATGPATGPAAGPATAAPARDLGSGERFGADVYELYEAGQVAFPDLAAAYGHGASELHYVIHLLNGIAGRLGHPGATAVAHQTEQVYDALATTCRRLHLTGEALVLLARDFRRTDETTAAAFDHLVDEHRDLLSSAPRWTPPPGPTDRPDLGPRDLPGDADLGAMVERAGIPPLLPDLRGS